MNEILVYVYRDLVDALRYLPWGIIIGGPIAAVAVALTRRRNQRKGRSGGKLLPVALLCIYVCIMMSITYFSRESGSIEGGMDFELFSTWGINSRNNAFVLENVLLFIPYGFLLGWSFRWAKNVLNCVSVGFITSLWIEYMQFITARGYFQIDDILTNTMGMFIGSVLCTFLWLLGRAVRGN